MISFGKTLANKKGGGYIWAQKVYILCDECKGIMSEFISPVLCDAVFDLLKQPVLCADCKREKEEELTEEKDDTV